MANKQPFDKYATMMRQKPIGVGARAGTPEQYTPGAPTGSPAGAPGLSNPATMQVDGPMTGVSLPGTMQPDGTGGTASGGGSGIPRLGPGNPGGTLPGSTTDLGMGGSFLSQLGKEIDGPIGLTDKERSTIYNKGRGEISGQTSAASEALREAMGNRGLRLGDSGFGDTAFAQIQNQGQQQLGGLSTDIAINEANRRGDMRLQYNQINLQRLLGGGGLQQQANATSASAGAAGNRLAWDKERFGKEMDFNKQGQAWNLIMSLYGGAAGAQRDSWNNYANLTAGAM